MDKLLDSLMSSSLVSSPRSSSSSSACRTPSPPLPAAAGGSKGGCAECGEEEEQEHMMFCLLEPSLLAPVFLDRFWFLGLGFRVKGLGLSRHAYECGLGGRGDLSACPRAWPLCSLLLVSGEPSLRAREPFFSFLHQRPACPLAPVCVILSLFSYVPPICISPLPP